MGKSIFVIGQINTACLYERIVKFLAKIMKSVKNTKKAIRDHDPREDAGVLSREYVLRIPSVS